MICTPSITNVIDGITQRNTTIGSRFPKPVCSQNKKDFKLNTIPPITNKNPKNKPFSNLKNRLKSERNFSWNGNRPFVAAYSLVKK